VSFLLITIPLTLLLSGALLWLVIRAAREGQFEDWEGPAARMLHDDDRTPEREGPGEDDSERVSEASARDPGADP
jgi:cbb3-type cytochrome oxidase maturation protein